MILSLYSRGMTTRDIHAHIAEVYGAEVSPALVSAVTDVVADEITEWQNRPNAMGFRCLTGCGWFLFLVTAGSSFRRGMAGGRVPRRWRPGPRPGGVLVQGVFGVLAGQAGLLAMVMTAGAIRVTGLLALRARRTRDSDVRERCRSRSTTFLCRPISLVTAW